MSPGVKVVEGLVGLGFSPRGVKQMVCFHKTNINIRKMVTATVVSTPSLTRKGLMPAFLRLSCDLSPTPAEASKQNQLDRLEMLAA